MGFELLILGSGAALPTGKRNPSAQYLNCNERHILIDCGEGTQNQLRKYGVKIQKIKIILISHLHGDHFFGLIGLLSTMNLLGRTQGVKIFAPGALQEIIELQLKASGHKYAFNVEFIVLNHTKQQLIFEDKLIEIISFPLRHRVPTTGFLIKEKQKEYSILGDVFKEDGISLLAIPSFRKGLDYETEDGEIFYHEEYTIKPKKSKSYAYCSDTSYFESIIPSINQVDLLYHEATFTDKHKDRAEATFHSTATQAATIAVKANASKLILGHISSRYEDASIHLNEARRVFQNVEVVEDGMKFIL